MWSRMSVMLPAPAKGQTSLVRRNVMSGRAKAEPCWRTCLQTFPWHQSSPRQCRQRPKDLHGNQATPGRKVWKPHKPFPSCSGQALASLTRAGFCQCLSVINMQRPSGSQSVTLHILLGGHFDFSSSGTFQVPQGILFPLAPPRQAWPLATQLP